MGRRKKKKGKGHFGSPEDGYNKISDEVRKEENACSNHLEHTQNQFQHQDINEHSPFSWMSLEAPAFIPFPKINYRHLSGAMSGPNIGASVVGRPTSYCFKCNDVGHLPEDCL